MARTIQSHTGADLDAPGLSEESGTGLLTGTNHRIGGIGLAEIAEGIRARHDLGYPVDRRTNAHRTLWSGGEYKWRREGPPHLF